MDPGLYNPTMCGIVGYVGSKEVVPVILEGLRRLGDHIRKVERARVQAERS